jgi:hypothetical protein
MRTCPGFARLLPLTALTGLAAGTIALLSSTRTVQAPALQYLPPLIFSRLDGGCSEVPAPVPTHGVAAADGRAWELADMPGHSIRALNLRNAEWGGVDLHGYTFTACEFRGAALAYANLRGAEFWECDLRGADLEGAELTGATYNPFTRWPEGFEPRASGARMDA